MKKNRTAVVTANVYLTDDHRGVQFSHPLRQRVLLRERKQIHLQNRTNANTDKTQESGKTQGPEAKEERDPNKKKEKEVPDSIFTSIK